MITYINAERALGKKIQQNVNGKTPETVELRVLTHVVREENIGLKIGKKK